MLRLNRKVRSSFKICLNNQLLSTGGPHKTNPPIYPVSSLKASMRIQPQSCAVRLDSTTIEGQQPMSIECFFRKLEHQVSVISGNTTKAVSDRYDHTSVLEKHTCTLFKSMVLCPLRSQRCKNEAMSLMWERENSFLQNFLDRRTVTTLRPRAMRA